MMMMMMIPQVVHMQKHSASALTPDQLLADPGAK